MSLQGNNVTIRMAIYYMILSLAVIESLKAFLFSYVYLSVLALSKDGQNSSFFCLGVTQYLWTIMLLFQLGQICNSCILFEIAVGLNPQMQNISQQNLPSFPSFGFEMREVTYFPNQNGKVKSSPRASKILNWKSNCRHHHHVWHYTELFTECPEDHAP